jgi:hypothetical protein
LMKNGQLMSASWDEKIRIWYFINQHYSGIGNSDFFVYFLLNNFIWLLNIFKKSS